MNPHSSHTHCQVAQADTQAKTWQRVCLPHPEKIELKKIPLPSENKKYATAQPDTTKTETAKLNKDKGLQTRKTEGLLLTLSRIYKSPPKIFQRKPLSQPGF